MPSPIMLSPTPDLHPIRQELLRCASPGHSSDAETAVPRHGPKNRGSWDPHLGQTARAGRPEAGPGARHPRGRQRIVRPICLAIATLSRRSRRGSRGPPFEPLQANSGPSGLNLVRCVFGAGAVATRPWTPPPSVAPPRLVVSAVVAVVMARRKHLARGGFHVRKSDVSNAIRRGEIVKEIVDHLRPWKDRVSEATVTAEVNRELDILLQYVPRQARWSDRTRNRAHAQKLDGALREVEKLTRLASTPGYLAFLLFSPRPGPSPSISDIEHASQTFAAELKRMRKVCALAVDP
jgi:hypothetical protein